MDDRGRHVQVAVVGPNDATDELCSTAAEVGRLLALRGIVVVTGGRDGVMAAACRGARTAGGLTVGFLPGTDRADANPWVEVVVPTGLGEGRDALVVAAADGVVAVGGSWGTLVEVALALKAGRPVVSVGGWSVQDNSGAPVSGIATAAGAAEAVDLVVALVTRDRNHG